MTCISSLGKEILFLRTKAVDKVLTLCMTARTASRNRGQARQRGGRHCVACRKCVSADVSKSVRVWEPTTASTVLLARAFDKRADSLQVPRQSALPTQPLETKNPAVTVQQ